jgi:hypothetical protein
LSKITADVTTGPAKGPRPASSIPHIIGFNLNYLLLIIYPKCII